MINRKASAYSETNTSLYQVAIAGGEPRLLTPGKDRYSHPAFSPDGKTLYANFSQDTDKTYNLERIVSLGWPEPGERKIITGGFDRVPSGFSFTPDSKTIYFLAEDSGHEKLYSVASSGGEVTPVIDLKLGVYTNLAIPESATTAMLFANWESAINPAEIVRIDLKSKSYKVISSFNAERSAQIDWLPMPDFW